MTPFTPDTAPNSALNSDMSIDSNANVIPKTQTPPLAVTLPLSGQHLIEASAGTGKTWTLTGIVLRLIIEAGYACDNIIASTFTRSASAEMRQRISERLTDMQKLLSQCQEVLSELADSHEYNNEDYDSNALHFGDTMSVKTPEQHQALKQQQFDQFMKILPVVVEKKGIKAAYDDPVNQYLITWLARHEFELYRDNTDNLGNTNNTVKNATNNLGREANKRVEEKADKETPTQRITLTPKRPQKTLGFKMAIIRTNNAITQLDRLFVGTLDSLCQKWLREFSADTGYQPNIQISNNVENIILAMIHDQLRAFRATVSEHEPAVFELMYASNRLPKAEVFLPAVKKALNFYSTPVDRFTPIVPFGSQALETSGAFDLCLLESLLAQIIAADSEALQPYAKADFRLEQGMGKSALLNSRFEAGLTIQKQLAQQGVLGLLQLSDRQQEWLASVQDFLTTGKGFNKGFDEQRQVFTAIPLIPLYAQLYEASQALIQHMNDLNQYFHRFICHYVRDRLPVVLEAQQITTFSLQLARLNQALSSKQGESLARYIRHQYPVALIDESQDINTEQAMLIQRIYLPQVNLNSLSKENAILKKNITPIKSDNNKRQFLLLVGDPKQAIYGFRGGDVANYSQLKAQFNQKPQELIENRRSSPAIIHALNHWFGIPSENPINSPIEKAKAPAEENSESKGEMLAQTEQAYFLGENIHYRPIKASREHSDLYIKQDLGRQNALREKKEPANKNHALPNEPTYQADKQGIFLLNLAYEQTVTFGASLTTTEMGDSEPETASDLAGEDTNAVENEEHRIDFNHAVTAQILALMDDNLFYHDEENAIRPLRLQDIGILADKNKQLDSLEQTLQQHGISTSRGGSQSLFAGEMTQDLMVLMQAMLFPYDVTRLRRLLLSHFFDLTLTQVSQLYAQSEAAAENSNKATVKLENNSDTPLIATPLTDIQQMITEAGELWQKSGFLTAIQWLLNQTMLLDNMTLNFWQRLAKQAIGERLLIDLRQLLDIISQLGSGNDMGEYQLLEWLEQQHAELPKEDWSIQQRLPSEDGVHLMTIHNSKGLEFPIVFVVGLDKKINNRPQTYQLYLYADNHATGLQNRRLSPVPYRLLDGVMQADHYKKIETNALYEEKLRLAYVALTRCRDRLYIVAQGSKNHESDVPLKRWLQGKTFDLPQHLTDIITQVDITSLSKYFGSNTQYQTTPTESKNTKTSEVSTPNLPLDYPKWHANIQHTQFIGWSNTSFTALSRHLQHDKQDVAVNQADYLFESDLLEGNVLEIDDKVNQPTETDFDPHFNCVYANEQDIMADSQSQSVRFTFEKGTNTGTFLHKILENLPPISHLNLDENGQLSPQTFKAWTPIMDRAVKTYQISSEYLSDFIQDTTHHSDNNLGETGEIKAGYLIDNLKKGASPIITLSPKHLELAMWLYEIMHTPLLAPSVSAEAKDTLKTATFITLATLSPKQKITELSFDMSLRQDFLLKEVKDLYQTVGIELNLNTHVQVANYWRYLRGEIDLIYQAGEQFFVMDYKSNYLGNQFASYDEPAMQQAMNEHGYWLQAGIYQVALHRYLTLRLPNYDIHQHLGAVEYAFLRGMSPHYPKQGRLAWQPGADFIQALDSVLGKAGL